MTIEFMVIAAPRSGTAWAANWLTTDTTLCLHEPSLRWPYQEWDRMRSNKMVGIACTAVAIANPAFVCSHPARKVILHRDLVEIRASMQRLQIAGDYDPQVLWDIEGLHCHWRQLFTDPEPIYTYLLQRPFDSLRHQELKSFNVQNTAAIASLGGVHVSAHG